MGVLVWDLEFIGFRGFGLGSSSFTKIGTTLPGHRARSFPKIGVLL